MNKTELQMMREAAHRAVSEALSAEARSNETAGLNGQAERAAFVAIDKIDELWQYARDLEDRLVAAEAKLYDAIDAEGPLAITAEIDGTV